MISFVWPKIIQYDVSFIKFLVITRFLMKVFRCEYFLDYAFRVGFRKKGPYLILHTILYVYPYIDFMNKLLSIFLNLCLICYQSCTWLRLWGWHYARYTSWKIQIIHLVKSLVGALHRGKLEWWNWLCIQHM